MVSAQRMAAGASAYVEREILPQLPTSKSLIVGAVVALYLKQIDALIAKIPKSMGITDDSRNVDIDAVCESLKQRMTEPIPVDIPMVGRVTFDKAEVDKLRRYIVEGY